MQNVKLLEDNLREPSCLGFCKDFFRHDKKGAICERIVKLDFIKWKDFFSVKDIVKRIKRQGTDWEKIFTEANVIRGLFCKIYKEFSELNKKINWF